MLDRRTHPSFAGGRIPHLQEDASLTAGGRIPHSRRTHPSLAGGASLTDLFELAREIFENQRVPEGSVFLFGSASYLARVGTGTFAWDWLIIVGRAEKQWRGIRVCPLIPLILSDCPGTLAREIAEAAAWFAIIYENNPLGLFNAWAGLSPLPKTFRKGGSHYPIWTATKYRYQLLFRSSAQSSA